MKYDEKIRRAETTEGSRRGRRSIVREKYRAFRKVSSGAWSQLTLFRLKLLQFQENLSKILSMHIIFQSTTLLHFFMRDYLIIEWLQKETNFEYPLRNIFSLLARFQYGKSDNCTSS
jgi:hypothetical protein